jgi:DNA-binding transcriptional LysR family regulator
MAVDLAKLEQLLTIARTGNFTRAAEELGITQPALSRNIGLLEDRFGFKIFDRGRGGASLTPIGALIVDEVEALVRQATILENNLQLYGRGEAGQISLGMGPQIAGLLLPGLGTHMLKTRPQFRMDCSLKTVDNLMPDLMDGGIEMIICASSHISPSSEIVVETLGVMRLGVLARSGHPIAARSAVTMSDLAAYPLAVESARRPPFFPVANGGLSCENSQILRDIVLESDALWFSSPQMVAKELAAGLMNEIDVVDLPFRHVEVGIVRLARRRSSQAASAIVDYVRRFLAESQN